MGQDYSHYISMFEVAARIQRSRPIAHKLCKRGAFPSAVKVGRYFFIDPADVDAYLSREQVINQTLRKDAR